MTSNPTTVQKSSDREVTVTRTFDAPARLVFRAWSEVALFQQWWVPRSLGATLSSCELDVRTGGTYRLVFGDDPATAMVFHGRYLEVIPDERIVWTNEEDGEEGASITTVTLEERGDTTLLVLRESYPTTEAFDAGAGAEDGLPESFAQLDEVLESLAD
jgi:uncharacterized protein YndB with AHSA1/START domain